MADDYLTKLGSMVRKLYQATSNGSLEWNFIGDNPEGFESTVGGRRVTVSPINYIDDDGDQMQDVEVAVFDATGRKVESIRDPKLGNVPLGVSGFSGWYALMSAILEIAKRRIDGSEQAIDDVIGALDDEIPF